MLRNLVVPRLRLIRSHESPTACLPSCSTIAPLDQHQHRFLHKHTTTNPNNTSNSNNLCKQHRLSPHTILTCTSSLLSRHAFSSPRHQRRRDHNPNTSNTSNSPTTPTQLLHALPFQFTLPNSHKSHFSSSSSPSSSSSSLGSNDPEKSENTENNFQNQKNPEISKNSITNSSKTSTSELDRIDKRAYPIAFSSLLMGTAIGIIIPLMPAFATDIGINKFEYGIVISVMGLTRLLFNIPSSYWADKHGRRPLLIGGPLLSAIGMCMTCIVRELYGLLASRFIVGAGGSLQMAGAQTYLADISNARNRARTMAPMQLGFSAGMALGPALGGFIADVLSVRQTFLITGVAIFAACVNNYVMCPETKPKDLVLNVANKGILQTTKETMWQWKELLKDRNNQCGLMMHTMFWLASSGVMFTLMPLFASNELNMSPTQLGELFGMLALINVFGAQPMAYVSDKFGRKSVIVPSSLILAGSALSLPFVTNVTELAALCACWATGSTMMAAGPMAYIADNNGNETRSQALAVLRSGGDLGLMMGSGALGFLAFQYDLQTATTVGAACLVAGGLNFGLRANKPKPHRVV